MTSIETLAVVGATGAVGRIVLELLQSRKFPAKSIKLLASKRSAGQQVEFGGELLVVEELSPASFNGVDIAIGSTPDPVAAQFVPWARAAGCVVVDESGFFRMQEDVPLVIPEVNPGALMNHQGIVASPNCSTTQMVVALKPVYDLFGIERVVVSTYQAVSGAGLEAIQELRSSAEDALRESDEARFSPTIFSHPIGFNLIPQIGSEKQAGFTNEEMKMVHETRKIMGDDSIEVHPTCVRVPVMVGHSESIYVETKQPVDLDALLDAWNSFTGITVEDKLSDSHFPTPIRSANKDDVFVGRIRKDLAKENAFSFWCVSDNLRKGAATNAVQIAELLASQPIVI